MHSSELKILEARGNNAVKRLRKEKLAKGFPFMINSNDLPSNQCYLEYPDGKVLLVELKSTSNRDFTIVRELTVNESSILLMKFQFA